MIPLTLDGISVIYVLGLCFLLVILLAIFAHRQIVRLRANNVRNKPIIKLPFSKRTHNAIKTELDRVYDFRSSYQARLTDPSVIPHHSNTAYVYRMICVDEVLQKVDYTIVMCCMDLPRHPGESTLDYLNRLRVKFPSLPEETCYRIAYLYEWARMGAQEFNKNQLDELRALLEAFVKIVNQTNVPATQPSPSKGLMTSLFDKVNPGSSRKRRIAGSDGGRLLGNYVADEQIQLLPISGSATPVRRKSEVYRSLLDNPL